MNDRPTHPDDLPIDVLGLGARIPHPLKRHGVQTLRDLCSLTIDELANFQGIGAHAVREIQDALHSRGLQFARDRSAESLQREADRFQSVDTFMFGVHLNDWAKSDQFLWAWVLRAPGVTCNAMRALMGLRAESLDEFLHYSREDLLAVDGVGSKTVEAIEESLRQRGLALRGEFS